MTHPSWERVERVFNRALEIDDPTEREWFVDRACAGNGELRSEILRLLAVEPGELFMEPPPLVASDLSGRVIGDFEVIEELGRGGMGVVYRARQRSLQREVALKVLPLVLRGNDAVAERFRREAIAASKLKHPGIATVLSFGEVDGTFYYAMELVEGPSLRDAMTAAWRNREVEVEIDITDHTVVADLVRRVAEALHYAHEHHVLHRDVKPQNILLERDGRPRLIDFGVAKLVDRRSVTLTGELSGTPQYMSPEQADSRRHPVDRRSDVYSLGVVLYELLAHQVPITGASSHEVLFRIANVAPPPLRRVRAEVPRDLETICMKALEKEPEGRYATARELALDLDRYLAGEPIAASPPGIGRRVRRTLVARRALLKALPLGIVAGVGGAQLFGSNSPPQFRAVVRVLGDRPARLVVRRFDEATGLQGEVLEQRGHATEFELDLPLGSHRATLIGRDGRFAEVRLAGYGMNPFFQIDVALAAIDKEVPEMVHVRGGTLHYTGLVYSSRTMDASFAEPAIDVAPFLVDAACLTNRQYREYLSASVGTFPPPAWKNLPKGSLAEACAVLHVDRAGTPEWDELPVTMLNWQEAQRLAAWYGKRLPTISEAHAMTYTSDSSWITAQMRDPSTTPFNLQRIPQSSGLGVGVSLGNHLECVEPVTSRGRIGPCGTYHPLGNVDEWTESPAAFSERQAIYFDASQPLVATHDWNDKADTLGSRDVAFGQTVNADMPFLTVGVRCVRSLRPV